MGSAQRELCQPVLPPNLQAAIEEDSTIDFSGFHHYMGLPDLSAFALSGFPFTRMADLSETVVLVPPAASEAQVSLLLNLVGGLGVQTGYPAYGLRLSDDWKQASALDADLLMLGALPAELRGSQQLSLLIDDQRTRLLNGQSPSPQQAMEQARRGSRDGDPAVTEVAVTAQAPFAAIIGMQSPHHAQRSIVSLAASNAADYGLLADALSDTGKREAIAGSVAILRTSGIHSQFVGEHYYVGALPWWLLLWYHLADHPALLAVLATLVVLMFAFLLWRTLRWALPATPGGTVAEQRQWLLQQVRIGEATGRQSLIEDALARLRMLAPDDRGTLVAILEVQLSQQKLDDAEATLARLRQIGAGSRELAAGERLWQAYRGDLQQELQQARLFAAGGRSEEALAIYRRLFNDDPPGLQLGLEYWRLRGTQAEGRAPAIRALTELDRSYPGNVTLLQALSQLLFAAGRDSEALAALQRMGRNPEARGMAADAEWAYLKDQAADERSVRRLQDFITRNPTFTDIALVRERYADQHKRVSDPAWRAGRRGQQLLDAGRNEDAERAFLQALRGYPREPGLLGGLGMALMRQGRREQAIAYFQRAVQATPAGDSNDKWRDLIASTRYWLQLDQADAALTAGRLDEAERLYAQARRQQPRDVNAALGLVDVAVARGDDAAAERQLQSARRIAPNDANVVRKLVQLYGRTDPQRLEAFINALPAAQRKLYAEDLRQLQITRLRERREQALAAGDAATAIELGTQLRAELPGDAWLAYALGNELRAAGREQDADAVVADMARRNGSAEARYAQALYLSGRNGTMTSARCRRACTGSS
ncbi:hypothetical protein G6F57_012861 [Rhizopus arrhizus]|nr:hypothetical protein G6F57_012861 [Rhizopus arrhizus]